MSHFVSVETPGGAIWVEVPENINTEGIELVASREQINKSFEESAQALKKNAQYLMDLLSSLGPTEVKVTFGITVGVEMGTPIFGLAKASGNASYNIELRWDASKKTNAIT
jgi:hypothetical protein